MRQVKLRPASPADLSIIREWHRAQNQRDGTSYPMNLSFNRDGTLSITTPIALIGESAGKPRTALYVERRGELMFAGCDPAATAFARRDIEPLMTALAWQGYSGLHCDVPLSVVESVRKPLEKAGFAQNDHKLAHFYRELEDSANV